MQEKTLHEIQYQAWLERASYYDEMFTDISNQAIDKILDSFETLSGKRHLDIACGTGHLVAAAVKRAAISEGVDFAETMVHVASANYPDTRFSVADATDLPYDDATFDMASCSFGLLHMERPQDAVNEAFRVLKPGGRFAFTLWCGNDADGIHALVKPALSAYQPSVSLPESWTLLRYADEDICTKITQKAGFLPARFEQLPIVWKTSNAHTILDIVQKLSIRTNLLIDSQPQDIQQKIYARIVADAEAQKVNGVLAIGWSALLTCVAKTK